MRDVFDLEKDEIFFGTSRKELMRSCGHDGTLDDARLAKKKKKKKTEIEGDGGRGWKGGLVRQSNTNTLCTPD